MTVTEQPKLQSYCNLVYAHMYDNSKLEAHEGLELRVWRGKLIKTILSLGVPDGTYKRVMDQLIALGCIEQVERGYRGKFPTTIVLIRPPTADVWEDSASGGLTRGVTPAILSARIDDLARRLGTINIPQALGELQAQIDDCKKSLQELHNNKATNEGES